MSKQLTPEYKTKRAEPALAFLQRYNDDGDEFLIRIIITDDEMWVAHITPETKRQAVHALASQWISLQDEIQADLSARKVMMCTVFWAFT